MGLMFVFVFVHSKYVHYLPTYVAVASEAGSKK